MNLGKLLDEIEEGRYAIPDVQRGYVWRNKQVLELFESISKNLPIGSILVWDMPREFIEEYNELLRPLADDLKEKQKNFQYMVIDGQQRLVSLYLAKKGSIKILNKDRNLDLFYNPTEEREKLRLSRGKELEKDPKWFRVSSILNAEVISDVLDEKERLGCSLDNKRTIQKRLEGFRDTIINYPVNIYSVPEKALQYDKSKDNFLEILENISEMFVRLNTTGTRIKLSDLVAAILTAKARERIGVSFRNRIMEIVDQFDKKGWDIDEPILTRTYMVIATNKTNFKEAKEDLENLASKAIIENLEKVSDALNRLISLLDRELNIKSDKYLKSKYSLVTLAYYEYKRGPLRPEDVKAMKRWLVLSSFSKRYTGRLESDLREDIAKIRDGKSFKDIEDFLTVKSIGKNLFDNSYDKEHLLTLLILLKDAYDLRTDALSRIGELKSSELNVHHIFPIEVLKKVYGEEIKIGETKMDIETAADLAANITIISKTANQQIEDKRPDEYLRNYSEEYLKTHCIPLDQELWKPKNYARFLEMRQKNLVEKINKIILHS